MLDQAGPQELLDALPIASAILDERGTILAVNQRWKSFSEENGGDTSDYYVGRNYLTTCCNASGDSSAEASIVADGIRKVIAGEPEFNCEYPCHSKTELRWFEIWVSPVPVVGGRLILVGHLNITSRRLQQDEVAASRMNANELAALVASATDAIMSYDLEGKILTWNKAATNLYGYTPDEAIGQSMEILYPDDWPVRITEYRDRIISGEMTRFEVMRKTKSGDLRHISISASPVRGVGGEVVAISNFHRDVTQQKAAEEHLKFITRELGHRTKNMFAIITAIERQTARQAASLDEFHEDFAARLSGLSASNDLLVSSGWRPVSLEQLCRSQLMIFADAEAGRVSIQGPPVLLDADAVQSIGLSLHELATNALKHGALNDPSGRISLGWQCDEPNGARVLTLVWRENSQAINGAPARKGFGHSVLTKVVAQKLKADVALDFSDGELRWAIELAEPRFRLAE